MSALPERPVDRGMDDDGHLTVVFDNRAQRDEALRWADRFGLDYLLATEYEDDAFNHGRQRVWNLTITGLWVGDRLALIRTSDTVAELFAALATAQAEMPSAAKDTAGQVGNVIRKYADLPAVREAARGPLTKAGLAFVQFPASAPAGWVRIITRVVHRSGEWIEDDEGVSVPTGNTSAQAVGSAMTYARRYSLMAALGIVADDDDDGAAATAAAHPTRARAPRLSPPRGAELGAHDPRLARRLHAELTKTFPDVPAATRDRWRHALVAAVTRTRPDGPVTSSNDLTMEEQLRLSEALVRLQSGAATITDAPDDTIELRAANGRHYTITLDPPTVEDHGTTPEAFQQQEEQPQ